VQGRTAFGPLRRQVVARDGHDLPASRSAPHGDTVPAGKAHGQEGTVRGYPALWLRTAWPFSSKLGHADGGGPTLCKE
jgi:hypothetical protein